MHPSTEINLWGDRITEYAYFKDTELEFNRYSTWLTLRYGLEKIYDNGFCFDLYYGVSIRHVSVQSKSIIPEEGTVTEVWENEHWTLQDDFSDTYLAPIIGFKIGFVFQ